MHFMLLIFKVFNDLKTFLHVVFSTRKLSEAGSGDRRGNSAPGENLDLPTAHHSSDNGSLSRHNHLTYFPSF